MEAVIVSRHVPRDKLDGSLEWLAFSAAQFLLGDLRDRPCSVAQGRPQGSAEGLHTRYFFVGPFWMNSWRSVYEDLPHKYRSLSRRLAACGIALTLGTNSLK